MRIEKRFLAYGHELDTGVTPLEAGLGFSVAWKTPCIGRTALAARAKEPSPTRLVTIVMDDAHAVPLGNEPVYDREGQVLVGKTTSAAFGYRIGKPLALAYVDHPTEGMELAIDIGRTLCGGCVTMKAAFDADGRLMRRKAASPTDT
jgi:glycine cleavage system aminomethyltransferase T